MLNKDIVVLSVKLFLITAIVAFCLAFVNRITEPLIKQNDAKTTQEAQAEVLPEATRFEESKLISDEGIPDGVRIESISIGLDDTRPVGYTVKAICSEGYGGDISVMVGIGEDLTVRKIKVIEMSETPGLGAKSQDEEFTNGYIGKKAGMTVTKSAAPNEDEVAAISGATITSKAVTKAVNAAIQAAQQSMDNGSSPEKVIEKQDKIEQIKEETDKQINEKEGEV